MNATVEDLLTTIGEQTIEIRMLRLDVTTKDTQLAAVKEELEKLKTNKKEK